MNTARALRQGSKETSCIARVGVTTVRYDRFTAQINFGGEFLADPRTRNQQQGARGLMHMGATSMDGYRRMLQLGGFKWPVPHAQTTDTNHPCRSVALRYCTFSSLLGACAEARLRLYHTTPHKQAHTLAALHTDAKRRSSIPCDNTRDIHPAQKLMLLEACRLPETCDGHNQLPELNMHCCGLSTMTQRASTHVQG